MGLVLDRGGRQTRVQTGSEGTSDVSINGSFLEGLLGLEDRWQLKFAGCRNT